MFGFPVYRPDPNTPGRFDLMSSSDDHYDLSPASDIYLAGFHAVAVVGYDENAFGGAGGYKIVNSWGNDWGNAGFAWLSERFLTSYGFDFYRMTDRADYTAPDRVHFKLHHTWWAPDYDNVTVIVGVGDPAAPTWSRTLMTQVYRYDFTLDMWADITEAAACLPPAWGANRWWIKVADRSTEDVGNLTIAEIETGATTHTAETVLPLTGSFFGGNLYAYIPAGEAASSNYYINDDSTAGDVYCTAPGNDANDGLTPATPKRSIQAIIDYYSLKPGNTVWIDAGNYNLNDAVTLGQLDRGVNGSLLRFVGALAPNGEPATVLTRPAGSGYIIQLFGSQYVQFENFKISGATSGFNIDGSWGTIGNVTIKNSVFWGASDYGIRLHEASPVNLANCRIYGFGGAYGIYVGRSTVRLTNCALDGVNKNCIALSSSSSDYASNAYLYLNHSILSASGAGKRCVVVGNYSAVSSATYNDLFTTGGATVGFTPDGVNLQCDPLFADPAGGDFHLKSSIGHWNPLANGGSGGWVADAQHSPCIDAGEFGADFSAEPAPNGGRLNIGVYGGTAHASKSAVARRYLFLDDPDYGATYRYICPIDWRQYGDGWQAGDTLRAEYSNDAGQSWHAIPSASALAYQSLSYMWDVLAMDNGTSYTVRLICNQDEATSAVLAGSFSIAQPHFYYVNDGLTAGDVYCTAIGHDANDGLTPSAPKATVQDVLSDYNLEPGDRIYIDTGYYSLNANVEIGSQDAGDAANPVRLIGSTVPGGTVFDRNNASSSYCLYINGASYVNVENLNFKRAGYYGLYIYNSSNCHVQSCRAYTNGTYGIYISSSNNALIDYCLADRNGNSGILLGYSDNVHISNCSSILNASSQVSIGSSTDNLTLRNNILWASGSGKTCIYRYYNGTLAADYNDLYTTGGATRGYDGTHQLNADPLFVDSDGPDNVAGNEDDDFHLMSTAGSWHGGAWTADATNSPCIDTGDPATSIGEESSPNGGRINLGAYGGTSQASRTTHGRTLAVVSPNGGEVWRGSNNIGWSTAGDGWTAGDTLRLEVSRDNGSTWSAMTGADALTYSTGGFAWDTTQVPSGPNYRIRAVCNQDEATSDTNDAGFTIHNTPLIFYVNDSSTAGDVYCAAVGNDVNDGLTSSTPKAAVQAVLDAYDLETEDILYVDTGIYDLTASIQIGSQDGGNAAAPVRIIGSIDQQGSLIDRNNAGSATIIIDANYISLEHLDITGGQEGVYPRYGNHCSIAKCRVFGNVCGVNTSYSEAGYLSIGNCLIYGNTNYGLCIHSPCVTVYNNTFALNGGNQIYYNSSHISLRNNIFSVNSAGKYCIYCVAQDLDNSDYNDFNISNGAMAGYYGASRATLAAWQSATAMDSHSIGCSPLFVDSDGADNIPGNADDDLHLKSTAGSWHGGAWTADAADSPCIDAGDPTTAIGDEPSPTGGRINLGAYGATPQASRTSTDRVITIVMPNGGELWRGVRNITWNYTGLAWTAGNTVRLEYSSDAGASWHSIAGADSLTYDAGIFSWDTTAVPSGASNLVRIICNQDGSTSDAGDAWFTIHNGPLAYYINDAATTDDVYCSAPGSDANDGLTSATPKATVQAILAAYDLEPGDIVYIDTGLYALASNISVTSADSGDANAMAGFVGSTRPDGTRFIHNGSSSTDFPFYFDHAQWVSLENIFIKSGYDGIYFNYASDCRATNCRIVSNRNFGVRSYCSNRIALDHCLIDRNAAAGVYLYYSDDNSIANCTLTLNGNRQVYISSSSDNLFIHNSILSSVGSGNACIYRYYSGALTVDYNDLYTSAGATVGYAGTHQLEVNPRFVDPDGPDNVAGNEDDDFHLQSTAGSWHGGAWTADTTDSPCIDAGDPATSVGDETSPNGRRVNMGAHGGTSRASRSAAAVSSITLYSPNGGESWRMEGAIRWLAWGNGWDAGDYVALYYSADAGTTWSPIPGASALQALEGQFNWNLIGLPHGNQYRVRVQAVDTPALYDDSDSTFTIGGVYYVNDASTTHDVYCTAPGNDANNGRSGATPKATIQGLLNDCDMAPGDMVLVDTGLYLLSADITVDSSDGGDSANHVRLVGSTHPDGSTLDRQIPACASGCCIYLTANYFDVENFIMRNAQYAVNVPGTVHRFGHRILNNNMLGCSIAGTITHNGEIKHNTCKSISLTAGSENSAGPWIIENNTLYGGGIALYGSANSNNIICNNIVYAQSGYCVSVYNPAAIAQSDYNDFFTTGTARIGYLYRYETPTLNDWRTLSGRDIHSYSIDPNFAEPGGDLHLKSTEGRWDRSANGGAGTWVKDDVVSACIDAGEPDDGIDSEPAPNGGRINMGAYGGTAEASKSPASARWLVFEGAGDSNPLHAWEPLKWSALGANWSGGETVRLEYSADSGGNWHSISGAAALAYNNGSHWWDSRTVPDGGHYRFRVIANSGVPTSSTAAIDYSVHNLQSAWAPAPADGATGVAITTNLGWNSANGASSYDVYLWKSSQARPAAPQASGSGLSYNPALSLCFGTQYTWMIIARNGDSVTTGPQWTFTTAAAPANLYVDAAGGNDANGDGSASLPFQTISMAQSVVSGSSDSPCSIRVAQGVYRELVTMQSYENLYGGYRASDWARDTAQYRTIIDGENSRRCVVGSNYSMLDGFTVRNGHADNGGGIYTSSVSPTISNCVITQCAATGNGGGIYFYYGSPSLTQCKITSCSATLSGGGLYVYYSSMQAANDLITSCSAGSGGGGIYTYGSSPQIVNCTIHGNQSGIRTSYAYTALIKNTILWNNGDDMYGYSASNISYCDIEDGDFAGQNGNLSSDPHLYSLPAGDFHLRQGSPCIDTGTTVSAPAVDLDGIARPIGSGIDMGCYEWNPATVGSVTVTLEPQSARDAGAQWRLAGGPDTGWKGSGTIIDGVLMGQYTVEFLSVTGWIAPNPLTVTVLAGQIVSRQADYIRGASTAADSMWLVYK